MALPVRILIARHGETEWNVERRYQGHLDSPLTDRGREQAACLADRLAREPLSAVYSSDLGRARETARPVAVRHDLELITSPLLREVDCGLWTGRTKLEIARNEPELSERYRTAPAAIRFPDGETFAEVQSRGWRFLTEVASRHAGEHIAVITHHIVVETLLARALELDLSQLWLKMPTGNCFLSVIEYQDERLRAECVYDGAHLGATAQPSFEGDRVA